MEIINTATERSQVEIDRDALLIVNAALKEACNGIAMFEFETRQRLPGIAGRHPSPDQDRGLMMATTIGLEVSYGQLAIFASSLKQPFNDWTDQHVSQGFAWRPGSVSFRCMVEAGQHVIEIEVVNHVGAVHPDAARVIEVPFEIPADGAVEVASIAETVPLSLPAGSFLLRCEFLEPPDAAGERVRLIFAKKDAPRFAVVRADPELSASGELLMTAQPAPG